MPRLVATPIGPSELLPTARSSELGRSASVASSARLLTGPIGQPGQSVPRRSRWPRTASNAPNWIAPSRVERSARARWSGTVLSVARSTIGRPRQPVRSSHERSGVPTMVRNGRSRSPVMLAEMSRPSVSFASPRMPLQDCQRPSVGTWRCSRDSSSALPRATQWVGQRERRESREKPRGERQTRGRQPVGPRDWRGLPRPRSPVPLPEARRAPRSRLSAARPR